MKFPVVNSLRGAYLPMILIDWVFGVGVIEFPLGKPRRILSALWSIANFLTYLGLVLMANLSEIREMQGSKISAGNNRIRAYFCVVFVGISMCLAPFRSKVIKKNLYRLIILYDRLEILGIPTEYDVAFKSHVTQLSVALVAISILMVLDFKFVGLDLPSETSRIGFLLSSHYLLVFAFVVDCTFSCIIRCIGKRFRYLNAVLVEPDSVGIGRTVLIRQSDELLRSVITGIYHNYSLSMRAAKKQSLLHVIRETRTIHRGLSKAAMEFNGAFGVQILLSVALAFLLITSLSYTLFIVNMTPVLSTSKFDVMISKIIAPMWITFYAIKVFSVVEACETTSNEANRTGGLIIKLLESPVCDEDVRDEINLFSLQLIQNPLNFTASGFFPINNTLICGMIGAVTTYLIIMIQMRSVYEPEKVGLTPNSTTFIVQTNDTT